MDIVIWLLYYVVYNLIRKFEIPICYSQPNSWCELIICKLNSLFVNEIEVQVYHYNWIPDLRLISIRNFKLFFVTEFYFQIIIHHSSLVFLYYLICSWNIHIWNSICGI